MCISSMYMQSDAHTKACGKYSVQQPEFHYIYYLTNKYNNNDAYSYYQHEGLFCESQKGIQHSQMPSCTRAHVSIIFDLCGIKFDTYQNIDISYPLSHITQTLNVVTWISDFKIVTWHNLQGHRKIQSTKAVTKACKNNSQSMQGSNGCLSS